MHDNLHVCAPAAHTRSSTKYHHDDRTPYIQLKFVEFSPSHTLLLGCRCCCCVAQQFMPKLRTHLDRSFENVQQAYDRVVEAGLQGEDAMTKMLEYAQEDAQKVQDESLKEIGMSEEDFTAACLKFQGHPEVMSLFQQVMQKQAALQLKLMGQA